MYKELVQYIIESIVDDPSSVNVRASEKRSTVILEVSVADKDMGRVIGKGGRIINAIRTIVQVQGNRENKRISLELDN